LDTTQTRAPLPSASYVRPVYYDVARHWTRKIEPHLGDEGLNAVLVEDFNQFTWGRWRKEFTAGMFPHDFESCDWWLDHRGRMPRFWRYVKHAACFWLVNFNLRLATLTEPHRAWRILWSEKHATVWDGRRTLFDLNFTALGVPPEECWRLAAVNELPPGWYYDCGYPEYYKDEVDRRHAG
jgi:hypothetical protein